MYAQRYRLRLIYGLILVAIVVFLAWGMFYTGTRVPRTANEQDVPPCPSPTIPLGAPMCFVPAPS